jgi:uncharacterized membrane protein
MRLPYRQSRHWNFYLAFLGALGVLVFTAWPLRQLGVALAASCFSLFYLALTIRDMPRLTPDYLRAHAKDEDAPPSVVFLLTLGIVTYVTVSLFMVINARSTVDPLALGLGIFSVAAGWLMINAMWGMHYAWEYYQAPKKQDDREQRGGLDFPGDELPNGMAFIYFSLVIAMTAQTSDTDVTDNHMRRIVSTQSLFGYLFNTIIVAAAINIVFSLGKS